MQTTKQLNNQTTRPHNQGTVFQTAISILRVIPRLRPGLLSLRSVLASSQILLFSCLHCLYIQQNNKTTKQQNNKTTRQQNNYFT